MCSILTKEQKGHSGIVTKELPASDLHDNIEPVVRRATGSVLIESPLLQIKNHRRTVTMKSPLSKPQDYTKNSYYTLELQDHREA